LVGSADGCVDVGWLPPPAQATITITTSTPLMIKTDVFLKGLLLAIYFSNLRLVS
jgi:hypothetical protein